MFSYSYRDYTDPPQSAEFINSEGDPISAPAAPSDEEAPPPKKKKRTSKAKDGDETSEKPKKGKETKPKAKKAAAGDEDEEVTRLKVSESALLYQSQRLTRNRAL